MITAPGLDFNVHRVANASGADHVQVKAAATHTKFRAAGACDSDDEADLSPTRTGESDWGTSVFGDREDFASAADKTGCCFVLPTPSKPSLSSPLELQFTGTHAHQTKLNPVTNTEH
jgi:hypothetical protein